MQHVIQVASTLQGAAGVDQVQSKELRHLPFEVSDVFWQLTERWETQGEAPKAMQAIQQVNVPKEGNRPISIFFVFWRICSSAWATSTQVRDWRRQSLPADIGGGWRERGSEELAADLLHAHHKFEYACTLDFGLLFDSIRPTLATKALTHMGMQSDFCQVLESVWSKQRRLPRPAARR